MTDMPNRKDPCPQPDAPCRETALARLRRIVETKEDECEKAKSLLLWLEALAVRPEGQADELLWHLLRDIDHGY